MSKYSLTREVGQGSSKQCLDGDVLVITFDTSFSLINEKEFNGCGFTAGETEGRVLHDGKCACIVLILSIKYEENDSAMDQSVELSDNI